MSQGLMAPTRTNKPPIIISVLSDELKRPRDDPDIANAADSATTSSCVRPRKLPCLCPILPLDDGESTNDRSMKIISVPNFFSRDMMSVAGDEYHENVFSSRLSNFLCKPTLSERLRQQAKNNRDQSDPSNTLESFPDRVLLTMMRKKGVVARGCRFDSLPDDFFHQPAFEDFDGFTKEIVSAVRKSDVEYLRRHHAAGKSLRVRNVAGESLLHVACRCQSLPVVDFLISEAGVPVHVCDMYGRTPLHDSMWVGRPNFHIADLILGKCPDLLLIKDQRGHTPLCYAREEHWMHWLQHLGRNMEQNLPRKLRY